MPPVGPAPLNERAIGTAACSELPSCPPIPPPVKRPHRNAATTAANATQPCLLTGRARRPVLRRGGFIQDVDDSLEIIEQLPIARS